ncbi:hypothetical protein CFP56_020662 [Quercus suber]|uniref:Uncharacterized protein n=1 Tax=Quercus suber TaxID=58331 RepID=A0AAW0KH27_QUESU
MSNASTPKEKPFSALRKASLILQVGFLLGLAKIAANGEA